MKGFETITDIVATDLIELVNTLQKMPKTGSVEYNVQIKSTGNWVKKEFKYVPLDNILEKIKENNNFALMQPIGVDENGVNGVKCVLIHKSGHVLESNTYPFTLSGSNKPQDIGAEISYYKRYSLGAFLGLATDDDTDGNDNEAESVTQQPVRKISPKQKDILLKYYIGENLNKLLEVNNISVIDDLDIATGTKIISEIMKRK